MKNRSRRWIKAAAAVVAIWVAGDYVYSRIVARQVARWEAAVERGADGVADGCGAYAVGDSDTALLMVHGINASPQHYAKLAPRLADAGFHCRVMRLPAFGEPIPEYAKSTHADWTAAIGGELAELRRDHSRVGVVAHSLGGAATIGWLLDNPRSADFAVLLAPAVAVSDERSPLLPTRAWHTLAGRTLLFTRVLRSPFGIDSHDPANADYPGRTPFTPRSVVDQLFKLMDANRPRAADFHTPLLMVLTEDDRVIDWRAAERFYASAPAPGKRLLMLDNSGHAIPIDYDWPRVAEAIQEFAAADLPEDG